MWIATLSFRNLLRRRRRTALTAATMVVGFVLLSISMGLVEGSYAAIIQIFTEEHTGHIQIHKEDYRSRPSLYKAFSEDVGEHPEIAPYVKSWAPRVYSGALAYGNQKAIGIQVMGIDPVRETSTTTIANKLSDGQFLSTLEGEGVLVTYPLARQLGLKVGDELILIAQAADGSIANEHFTIEGVLGKAEDLAQSAICYLPLRTAQEFFVLGPRIHEIAMTLEHYKYARRHAEDLRLTVDDETLDVQPWQVVEEGFYSAMEADKRGNWISLGIITAIVALGVLNTVLMTLLERTREYGVIKALGTSPAWLLRMILAEISLLSLIGISIGALASLAINGWFTVYGLELPTPIEFAGNVFTTYYSVITWDSYLIPAAVIFGASLIVTIPPSVRILRMLPAEALRRD